MHDKRLWIITNDDSEDIALSADSAGNTEKKKGKKVAVPNKRKKGTMFLKSVDASGLTKDADTLYGIFNEVVQLIGSTYIVQFITDNEATYKAVGKRVINARWDKQLSSPLHSAGCYLNPGIFFKPSFKKQEEVTRGLLSTITALVPDDYMQDLISSQLEEYKQAMGDFGMAIVVRQREKLNLEALDPVSLDNIDVLADWVSEEESVITQEDLDNDGGWDVLQPEPIGVNLEDEEVHYEDEEDALHDIPSQYDWEFGWERDPYHYIE
ncbi:hypothetical protein RJ640_014001 [Escallonia rubra]|uniref:DUF659 domain-containing protein n=1 Tax=Escallonia rubra TaxID=112253 RepID=A0AA88U923_9ASTE|nr:hypothetical protein RJ640_014001 [Escallonia rubra]